MGHSSQEGAGGEHGRRLSLGRLLILAAVVLSMTFAGLWIWDGLTSSDPVRLIRSGSVTERQKAASDLGGADEDTDVDRVMTALVSAMEDTDVVVRSTAAQDLAGVAAEVLRRPARTPAEQKSAEQKVAVAIRTLTKGLSDPEPTIRASAVFGFGLLGQSSKMDLPPELIAALSDESSSVRQATAKALKAVQLTPGVVPALIEALGSRDREVRFHAAEILERVGPGAEPAVPALLATMKEPFDLEESKRTRDIAWRWDPACGAAKALGRISASREVIAGLAAMLSSDVAERISSAAEGLGNVGPGAVAAVPPLIAAYDKALNSVQHRIGQSAIAAALGRIAPKSGSAPGAVAILIQALDSKDWTVRVGAAQALGQFGVDAAPAMPRLGALRQDSVNYVRDAATAALATIEAASGTNDPHAKNDR
ncbi:MAG: HEAT repeat domain-containing protein [Isosphaerales bacterium]